jgi:hypothetical protein
MRPVRCVSVHCRCCTVGACASVEAFGEAELACRPGSVTTVSVTWEHSPKPRLTCGLTSHRFSSVPASFHALAELRRNWQIPGRRWHSRKLHEPRPAQETFRLRWSSLGDWSAVDLDVFDTQSRLVAIAAQRVQDLVDLVVDLL